MTDRLPQLLDCKGLREELGISRAAAAVEQALRRPFPAIPLRLIAEIRTLPGAAA